MENGEGPSPLPECLCRRSAYCETQTKGRLQYQPANALGSKLWIRFSLKPVRPLRNHSTATGKSSLTRLADWISSCLRFSSSSSRFACLFKSSTCGLEYFITLNPPSYESVLNMADWSPVASQLKPRKQIS